MMDISALASELQTDPNGYGYAAEVSAGRTSVLAAMLNEIRDSIDINREMVPAYEVFEAIVPAEWQALTAQEKERIGLVLSMTEVNVEGANTRATFQAAFGAGTATRSNLMALLTRKGSRAEQLFGQSVSRSHVAAALAL